MRLKFPSSPAGERVTSPISLYDAGAAWNGGWMTESAYSSIHGAEISERSTELVLPSSPAVSTRGEIDGLGGASADAAARTWRTAPLLSGVVAGPDASAKPELEAASPIPPEAITTFAFSQDTAEDRAARDAEAPITASRSLESSRPGEASPASFDADPGADSRTPYRGQALPGDRGPLDQEPGSQRPSFWRRIALGRRAQSLRDAPNALEPDSRPVEASSSVRGGEGEVAIGQVLAARRALATRDSNDVVAKANESVERRIVEPLLQALVSVEAKLERSHVDLVGRSDQVEQRLTQLWDIEEQLGALGELQESVLHVTEQQRRLEAALVAQTRILRWLVGGIILSLAVAAFSVAFFLRVAG